MNIRFHDHVDAFLHVAGPMLESREDTASLALGVCSNLKMGRTYGDRPPLFVTVSDGEVVRALAVRTPPHKLILVADDGEAEGLKALADRLYGEGVRLPGCRGTVAVAETFAQSWLTLTGCDLSVSMRQRIFRLDAVVSPRPAPGRLRRAEDADIPWLVAWTGAFHREAVPGDPGRDQRHLVDWLMEQEHLWVWDDGRPVSICAAVRPTKHGIAIGLVYTPPEHRGHGYASNCVAHVSQSLLNQGYDFCTLFTDLSNPTSNKIYPTIGYRPLAEFRQIEFVDASP